MISYREYKYRVSFDITLSLSVYLSIKQKNWTTNSWLQYFIKLSLD